MNNSPFNQVLNLIVNFDFSFWYLVKLAILLGLFLYIGFSIMIVRQVDLMSRSLNGSLDKSLKILAWLYLIATVIIFFLAVILL